MSLVNLATKVPTTSTATQKINTVNAGKVTIDTTKPLVPVPTTVTNDYGTHVYIRYYVDYFVDG